MKTFAIFEVPALGHAFKGRIDRFGGAPEVQNETEVYTFEGDKIEINGHILSSFQEGELKELICLRAGLICREVCDGK